MNRILLCRTCNREPGPETGPGFETERDLLADALSGQQLDTRFEVAAVDCMGACEQPVSLAFQGKGRATLVFAGLSIAEDVGDIIATGRAWLAARDGWIEDARPCGRLRLCLRTRIPALDAD